MYTFEDWLNIGNFETIKEKWVAEFSKEYNWAASSVRKFYNLYLEFSKIAGDIEDSDKYAERFVLFATDRGVTHSRNFIYNFQDSIFKYYQTNELISFPQKYYKQAMGLIEDDKKKRPGALLEAWNKTVSQVKGIGSDILETGLDAFNKILDSILKNPLVIILIVLAVVFLLFWKK